MRFHYTFTRMPEIKESDNNKCWWGCGTTHILLIGVQNDTTTLENCLGVSNKSKYRHIGLLYAWKEVLLSTYSREMFPQIHKMVCFKNVHSSFIHNSQKIRGEPKSPSTIKWKNCDIFILYTTTQWYSKITLHTENNMDELKSILLSKKSQILNYSLHKYSKTGKTILWW